ncbi:MAG: GTPase HflX [Vicinamibacteria bacterium]|nr:GTPase HflX [Vicinamibacteria bacterium]
MKTRNRHGRVCGSHQAERAILVGLSGGAGDRGRVESSLNELRRLTESAGATVLTTIVQERRRPDAAMFIGRGKAVDIARAIENADADIVVFDDELSPAQQRNLERVFARKTLDRTQLILDIFAMRARTREGRLQVELAQLEYLLPRLAGRGVLLSRLGAGIGTRGPGETLLETDRRRIRRRIQSVRAELDDVRRQRRTCREGRGRSALPIVALVGYTNAGKSTLFNVLTSAGTEVSNRLFMTLDPLIRRCRLDAAGDALLVDTVGFIHKLPHQLVAAFRATLEEATEADLIVHVMDASAEEPRTQEAAVQRALEALGAADQPRIRVFNKIDRLDSRKRARLDAEDASGVRVSARSGEGVKELRRKLTERLALRFRAVWLRFPIGRQDEAFRIYRLGRVLAHETTGHEVRIHAELPERWLERYKENLI